MDGYNPIEDVRGIIDALRKADSRFRANENSIRRKEDELMDIEHEVEFGTVSAPRRVYFFNEMRRLRKERRQMKVENEILYAIINLLNSRYGTLITDLEKCLAKMERAKENAALRAYFPRVRKDLSIGTTTQVEELQKKFNERRLG